MWCTGIQRYKNRFCQNCIYKCIDKYLGVIFISYCIYWILYFRHVAIVYTIKLINWFKISLQSIDNTVFFAVFVKKRLIRVLVV